MRETLRKLTGDEPLLAWTAWLNFALVPAFVALMPLDDRTVLGLDPWVKPTKFALSIGVYTLTIAALLRPLTPGPGTGFVRAATAYPLLGELLIIATQAARGTRSHFNHDTPLDDALYALMGLLILAATLAAGVLLVLHLRAGHLPRPLAWSVRLGLLVMLLGSAAGGQMVGLDAHTVGAEDGGDGAPFVDWSRTHGDLRAAHFLGLHAVQVLPAMGLLITRAPMTSGDGRRVTAVSAFALLYAAAVAALYVRAMAGLPVVPG